MQQPANPEDRPADYNSPVSNPRFAAAVVFVVSVAVLGVAFALTPSEKGVGTHRAMGLPACGLLVNTGVPCVTCGMTTSFSYAAHGSLMLSFLTQPAGAVLAMLTAMSAVLSGYALVTGMSLVPIGVLIWRPRFIVIAAAVLLIAWAYKIVVITGLFGVSI
jgi:uncharacterized protein DUF2752